MWIAVLLGRNLFSMAVKAPLFFLFSFYKDNSIQKETFYFACGFFLFLYFCLFKNILYYTEQYFSVSKSKCFRVIRTPMSWILSAQNFKLLPWLFRYTGSVMEQGVLVLVTQYISIYRAVSHLYVIFFIKLQTPLDSNK